MKNIKTVIEDIANKYSIDLQEKISQREIEMKHDNKSHYLIYNVLGISNAEGDAIDLYQNKGRFLYKYVGSFLEEATIACFTHKYPICKPKVKVKNTITTKPKNLEIDCLVGNKAYEIKWRDATTDGDHITKEHTRVKAIKEYGYVPIRLMFYNPNREQAIKIQHVLQDLYAGLGGEYYAGNDAWQYLKYITDVDLKNILLDIASQKGM